MHPALRRRFERGLGALPFLAILAGLYVLPLALEYPEYKLPALGVVWQKSIALIRDGSLERHVGVSLYRLALGFVIGNGLAIPLGIAIAVNRHVADLLRPMLTFLQSIAGIAWVPLAVIWFGIGD